MTRLRSTLGPVLLLAALAAIAVPVAASAASSKGHEKRVAGRITAITTTGLTIGDRTFTASSRKLAGLATGDCVELKLERRAGALVVKWIKAEDSCASATTTTTSTSTSPTTTTGGADDPGNHDAGDDSGGNRASKTATIPTTTTTTPITTGGADDPANHGAGDDRGRHGGGLDG